MKILEKSLPIPKKGTGNYRIIKQIIEAIDAKTATGPSIIF